jgi:Ca2+-binding RTX toxin-like protein
MNKSRGATTLQSHATGLASFAGQHGSFAGAIAPAVHTDGQGPDLIGTSGDDFILGTDSAELIKGLSGNDELVGFGHADTVDGGNGDDILDGGKGDDLLTGRAGHDIILGEEGNDTMVGGAGSDWAYFHDALFTGEDGDNGVVVDLGAGTAVDRDGGTDTLFSFEDVIGTLNGDVLTGDAGDNLLSGYFGSDTLNGGDGNDFLETGGGLGSVADGGAGEDTVFLFSSTDFDLKINLAKTGEQQVASDTSITLVNVENVSGYYYNDKLIGSAGDNKLYGDFGDDLLRGAQGNDSLYGDGFDHGDGAIVTDAYSIGDDTLVGGIGNDTLNGGGGADNLQGGFDADTFVYEFLDDSGKQIADPLDHITDLTNDDAIDLTAIEANYGVTLTLVDHFTGSGTEGAGEITLKLVSVTEGDVTTDTTYLKVDVDGDGQTDMTVALDGDHTDFTNFVL